MSSQVQIQEGQHSQLAIEPAGIIFNIMHFSLHDGPGIRTTVFFKGCPLSCWWCHNPESRNPRPELMYFKDRCRHCGECVSVCPHGATSRLDGIVQTSSACRCCGTCVEACAAVARELVGRRMRLSEVLAEIEKDLVFFDESGGGVTFSGGEPLAQAAFLEALVSACRERRIQTVLETCGLASREVLLRVARKVSLVLYDVKLMDPARHKKYTGVSSEPVLQNLEALAADGRPVIVRVPVIPRINDGDEDLRQLAAFLAPLGLRRIDLLPYHKIGIDKYSRLSLRYELEAVEPPSPARMEELAAKLNAAGFAVKIGG